MRVVVGAATATVVLASFAPAGAVAVGHAVAHSDLRRASASPSASADGSSRGVLPYFDVRVAHPKPAASGADPGSRPTSHMRAARAGLARDLGPRAAVEVDPATGTVRMLERLDGALTSHSTAKPATRAWGYVRANTAALGLDRGDLPDFHLANDAVTNDGLHTLRWVERYRGIPAFDNDLRVNVDHTGRILNVLGSPLHNMTVSSVDPRLSAAQAMKALEADVGSTRSISVTSASRGTRRMTHFSTGDFARLVIFGGDGVPRLGWHLTFAASSDATYDAVVDARTGRVLYRQNLTKSDSHGTVWQNYPGAAVGGAGAAVDFSTPTTASPTGYVTSGATTLTGPNAHAWSDINDNDVADAGEDVPPSSGSDFTYPFTSFNTTASGGACSATAKCSWDGDINGSGVQLSSTSWQTNQKQNAVQAFYFVNKFHDHLASPVIDFTAANGGENFEGDDPVLVAADDGADTNDIGGPDFNHLDNANMTTNPVGTSPTMRMYLFNNDPNFGTFRDVNGGDDAVIVYHEYTHGLSNRLITNDDGTGALSSPEAGAMGEGWSDWYAEDFVVHAGLETDNPGTDGEIDVGKYADAVPNSTRSQPMDCPVGSTSPACPGGDTGTSGGYTFGDFGSVGAGPEVHADGEIWGETLWDLRAAMIAYTGDDQTGSDHAERVITDAMRLSPPEPSYLDERNAILAAIQADFSAPDRANLTAAAWTVFSNRGMGFYAGAADGSDVNPIQDFSLPPTPGGPIGAISGTVTSADTGLPVSGVKVAIGGQGDGNAADPLVATTNSSGHYVISDVPVGTYGDLVVYASRGFDQVKNQNVAVTYGHTTARNMTIHRDWSAASGGATVHSSDETGAAFGCGSSGLIDQTQGTGWSSYNPTSTNPQNPHTGSPTATILLPQSITVRGFLADPGNTCGDSASASTKGYRIETSSNGSTWTVAASGQFAANDAHQLNQLTPTAGTTNVRYVRLIELSPQSAAPGDSGADFIDFSELEVLGAPPNVLPSGSLNATPSTVTKGGTVRFSASSFHDPDSLITGYSWDFDGDGTTDESTTGPTATFTYPRTGTFTAKVTVHDFEGGSGHATKRIVVKLPTAPKVTVGRPKKGSNGKLKMTLTCIAKCHLKATEKVPSSRRHSLGLASSKVGSLSASLSKPGKKTVTIRLTSAVLNAMKRHHVHHMTVTVRIVASDANHRTSTVTRHVVVHR